MSVRLKPLLALAALACALACAAPAAAQQAPTLGQESTPAQTAAPPDTSTSTGNGGLKTWQEILIFSAGLVLIAGIGFAIVGDARERSRKLGRHGDREAATAGSGVPHKHRAQAKSRARAKGRAAKAQRRKNR